MATLDIGVCDIFHGVAEMLMRSIDGTGSKVVGALVAGRYVDLLYATSHPMFQQKHTKFVLTTIHDHWTLDLQLQREAGNDCFCFVFRLGGGQEQANVVALISPRKTRRTELGQTQNGMRL